MHSGTALQPSGSWAFYHKSILSQTTEETMGGFFGVSSKEDCMFDLFFGTDYFATKYSKQFIPINHARANFCFGINFTFGKKHEI